VNAHIRRSSQRLPHVASYREVDPIKKGDLLFEIDPRPFQAALDQAKGQIAQAEAKARKTELDVNVMLHWSRTRPSARKEYDDAVQANLEAKAAVLSAKATGGTGTIEFLALQDYFGNRWHRQHSDGQIGDLVGPSAGELTTVFRPLTDQSLLQCHRTGLS